MPIMTLKVIDYQVILSPRIDDTTHAYIHLTLDDDYELVIKFQDSIFPPMRNQYYDDEARKAIAFTSNANYLHYVDLLRNHKPLWVDLNIATLEFALRTGREAAGDRKQRRQSSGNNRAQPVRNHLLEAHTPVAG